MAAPQGRLSPLGAEEEPNGSAGAAPPKPRRRRQRPVADENAESAEGGAVDATIDGEVVPPQKPKRRRPKAAPVTGGDGMTENPEDNVAEATLDGTNIDGTVDGEAPQRRRRKKKKPQGEGAGEDPSGTQRGQTNFALDLNLDDLKDDIVVLSPTTINVSATTAAGQLADATYTKSVGPLRTATAPMQTQVTMKPPPVSAQQPTSQNDTSLYIEERSKFRKTDKEQLQKEAEARLQMQVAEHRKSLLDAAVLAHTVVAKFALFCEGLLAGFAFWHIIVVAIMMNTLNYTPLNTFLFQFYGPFSSAASTIYFFLLYFSLLNAMDRIDIASISRRCGLKCATFQIPGICIIMYFIALVLHMVCVPIEDQMWIGYTSPTTLNATTTYSSTLSGLITSTWYPVSIGRAILVIVSWLLLAVYPYKDRLRENLIKHKSGQEEFESENMQPIGGRATEA